VICAYCGREAKGTKEHIISCAILNLFPECFITFDNVRNKVHLGDPVVKDVCKNCNENKIAYIDYYAKSMITDYFLKKFNKDDVLEFSYNYTLIQKILLKYAFNDLRSHKDDTSFFTQNILDFLMTEAITDPLRNITIIAGLAINTSPVPDYMFGNIKIRWGKNPIFLSNSIVTFINYDTGEIFLRDESLSQEFKNLYFSYLFRFNSGQFIILCWDHNIADNDLRLNNVLLKCQYPYSILKPHGCSNLSRCTSEITYHTERLIDVIWGQGFFDDISFMRGTFSFTNQQYFQTIESIWQKEEERLAKKYPRKN